MSINLPNKSSRAGRFKKKLVPEVALEKEAPVIHERMNQLLTLLENKSLSPAEFCALYIIAVLSYRYPGTWLGAKRSEVLRLEHELNFQLNKLPFELEPNIQKRLVGLETIGDVFGAFAFKSTPLTVNRAVLNWSTGQYALELMFHIPRPQEVLKQQMQGHRCVTIVLDIKRASKFILGERDALGFTMHDLIHADHFYHNNQSYKGQLGFYGLLESCMRQDHFTEHLQSPAFEHEFEYVISDMNAYAVHLMKCFKSALIHYHDNGEVFFQNWLEKLDLNSAESEALTNLNSALHKDADHALILSVLSRYEFSRNLHLP